MVTPILMEIHTPRRARVFNPTSVAAKGGSSHAPHQAGIDRQGSVATLVYPMLVGW
jgi:hypothetical protein